MSRVASALFLLLFVFGCSPVEVPPVDDDDVAVDDDDVTEDDDDVTDLPSDDDDVTDPPVDDDDVTEPPVDDDDTTPVPEPHPLADVVLYINLGDSVSAGYDASGNNSVGGKGFARLIQSNHADYPAYADHHLEAVAGSVDFRDLGDSGAASGEILENLEDALGGLPTTAAGDVLVTISAGGNDFNDSVWTMVTTALTEAAAATLRANLAEMTTLLRDRYEDADTEVFVVYLDIQDPIDGTATIPPQFEDGFCGMLQNPAVLLVGDLILSNLGIMNTAIAEEAVASGASLASYHDHFAGHGMNAADADRWMSDDCAHPMDVGHHELRRLVWGTLTGDWL